MNANELMIGNYLMELTSNDIFQVSESYYQALNVNLECSRPIPLTEKWLLDFGFQTKGTYDNYKLDGLELDSSVRIISTNERSSFHVILSEESIFNKRIDFVNELQNLYFVLTGNHLQLVIPK